MVCGIRTVQMALGDGLKRPTKSEIKNIKAARKSLVANEIIKPGDIFSDKNLTAKRPGYGISPMLWDEYIGRKASKSYQINDFIDE